ncbi:MAG: ATP-binding cassette domain-containing protein [Bacteroidales bacterium]|nr:ATP-binding cassette domain-containing protein [Bacteroidales bacterium]
MNNPVIHTKKLSIVQDNKTILQNVDIELHEAELTYLIGKVGSGKTSLIKTLYADLPIGSGGAGVNNFELENLSPKNIPFLRRTIGIVFQDFKLLIDRNVHQNLQFVLEATGWKDIEKINHRIKEVLHEVDLEVKEFKMPNELSGGEQQRVVIARALLNQPPLILADEPTGNLDPESSNQIMQILKAITRKGSCVLVATHQYNLIKQFPGRVLRIQDNQIDEIDVDEI